MPLSIQQQKLLAFAPRVSASLSVVGSASIIKSTVEEIRDKTATTYHRLLLSMSVCDLLSSIFFGMSTWAIPKGTPGVWKPMGNMTTCTVQGFMTQVMIAIPVYNATLAVYLLLISRYGWNEKQTRKVEPLLHLFPMFFGVGGGIAGLIKDQFNNAILWCWFAPFPLGCKDSIRYGEEANCVRGDNAFVYRYAFAYGAIWLSFLVAAFSLLLVYLKVLRKEKDVDRYQEDGLALRKQSRRVAWQSFLYLTAFVGTFWPGSILRLLQAIPSAKGLNLFPLIVCHALFLPLQGFLNFLVYFRSRFVKHRRNNPRASIVRAVWQSSFGRKEEETTMKDALSSVVGSIDTNAVQESASVQTGSK